MLKRRIEKHFKFFGVLLLVLAALNTLISFEIFPDYPLMALANGAVAIVIVVCVILLWEAGKPEREQ